MSNAGNEKKYPVHEVFYSWQGEGDYAGRAAFFVRLFGCPIRCPWCDSAGTWHPDFVPEKIEKFSAGEITALAKETKAEFVVITGGEPTIHDLKPLVGALHAAGFRVHLETAGAFPVIPEIDWITLSPKRAKLPLPENVARADELKIIVDEAGAIDFWENALPPAPRAKSVWLHPEWSLRNEREILNVITNRIRERGAPYRAGWQLHKCYNADAVDPRSRA